MRLEHFRDPRRALLLDLRESPSRNDDSFEATLKPHRQRMLAGWRKVAVVVRSVAGRLQVSRHSREDGFGVRAFTSLEEATAFLES